MIMKKYYAWLIIIILFLIFSLSSRCIATAKTMYVTDMVHASMRTGPSVKNKIIAFVKSNHPVEVLDESKDWSYVRIENRKEGWMLSRFLIEGPTKEKIIEQLKTENEELKNEASFLKEENARLTVESLRRQDTIREQERTLFDLKKKSGDRPTRWLLSGALVLLTGIFLGYFSRKKKKSLFT